MNQKLKDIKEKVRKIDEKVEAGESVRINLSTGGVNAEPIRVNETKKRDSDTGAFKSANRYPQTESSVSKMRGEHINADMIGNVDAMSRTEFDWAVRDESAPKDFDIDYEGVELTDDDINEIVKNAPNDAVAGDSLSSPVPTVNLTYDVSADSWILTSDCVYTTDDGWTITAKKDFVFDLASVPRFLWAIISSFDLSLIAPLYHDLLYRNGGLLPDGQLSPVKNPPHRFTRKEADRILYELMKKAQVIWWKREAAYRAVRTFSGFAWKG